jgi:rifampicin phosphotransferase
MEYVQRLDAHGTSDRSKVGGKGAGLARLTAAGIPVPPGFVVTTDAYVDFLARNDLSNQIEIQLKDVDYDDTEQLSQAAARIRELILHSELPEGLKESIVASYQAMSESGDPFVAVRSSGTAEDMGEASFAGLYDSYLDVRGATSVVDAVRKCWGSLWTARCASYRHRLGLDNRDALVAVVVQQMVAAQSAGVMFTANPLNERTDEIVINSTWGLGETIASGIVTPDELILDAGTLRIKRSILGSKELRIDRRPDGAGTTKTETAPADRAALSLTEQDAMRLGELGRKIQKVAGGLPQDIEWALFDASLYIVQSRDVTGADFQWDEDVEAWQTAPDDEDTVWTHAWAEQYWTGGVTPLMYSLRAREMRNCDIRLFTLWGFDEINDMRRYKYRRSTVYASSDADRVYYRLALPPRLRQYALGNLPPEWREEAKNAKFDVAALVRMYARVQGLTRDQGPLRQIKSIYRFINENTPKTQTPSAEELRHLSDDELKRELQAKSTMFEDYLVILRPAFHVYSSTAFAILRELLNDWYDGDNAYAFQDLISGLPKRTAMLQEQIELWELADQVHRSPQLRELLETAGNGAAFFAAVHEADYAAEFAAAYDKFLADHGHRGHQDRDIWYPRRSEDPQIDFQSLRTMVIAGAPSPVENEHRLVEVRLATTEEVLASVRRKPFGSVRAEILKAVIDYIHRFLVLRDDERPFADHVTMAKKRAAVEIGRRLFERASIERSDDFYFLAQDELSELLDGRAQMPLVKAKISNRRKVFDAFIARTELPPDYLRGNTPLEVADGTGTGLEGVFQGVGMSRGLVTGTARIVGDLREIGRVSPGEILICNSTDPGWTPVFGLISGLVIEAGGMLSHGACLSREYGLPAVTLPGAMQKIEDGQTITVNGDSGRVSAATSD